MAGTPGRLDVIATPIGNLGDLSPRARAALAAADVIAAEDTRHTRELLAAIGVSRPLVSLHQHNEVARSGELLQRLQRGERVALVSDAGTPLLSDPGGELVRQAAAAGISICAIPGPSAISAALSIAGIATERFCFEGFLPAKSRDRRERLATLAGETRTLVFFEAPHRIAECLDDMSQLLGNNRTVALTRELTKIHETVYRGTLIELARTATSDANMARGEITLVIAGAHLPCYAEHAAESDRNSDGALTASAAEQSGTAANPALLSRTLRVLLSEFPPSRAAALAAQITGARRQDAYQLALRLGGMADSAATHEKS